MFQVAQSPFLQALGFAIINSLWQFALLWLVYMLLNTSFRFASSRRYVTALVLQFAGFLWFSGTLFFYYKHCSQIANAMQALPDQYALSADLFMADSLKGKMLSLALKGEHLLPYLSLAYIIFLSFLTIKTIKCYRKVQVLRTSSLEKIGGQWRVFVQQLSLQIGIKKTVKIYLSSLVESPVTLGFLKPIILLPLATITTLNTHQIEAVLLHELAHIKRNDYIVNLLLSVIETTLFFNPFMQLLSKQIKRERENSCDDWVLQYKYSAALYAKALLTIAKNRSTVHQMAMHITDDNRALLIRVKRMIEKKERSYKYSHHLAAFLFTTLLITFIAWLTPVTSVTVKPTPTAANVVVVEPLSATVDNPFFNPVFFLAKEETKKEKSDNSMASNSRASIIKVHHLPLKSIVLQKEENVLVEKNTPKVEYQSSLPDNKFQQVNFEHDTLQATLIERPFLQSITVDWKKIKSEIDEAAKQVESNKWRVSLKSKELQKQMEAALEQLNKVDVQKRVANSNAMAKVEAKKALEQQTSARSHRRIAILIESKTLDNHLKEIEEQPITPAQLIEADEDYVLGFPVVVHAPVYSGKRNGSNDYARDELNKEDRNWRGERSISERGKKQLADWEREAQEDDGCRTKKETSCPKGGNVKKLKIIRI